MTDMLQDDGGVPLAAMNLLRQGDKIGAIAILRQELGLGLKEAMDRVDASVRSDPSLQRTYEQSGRGCMLWVVGFLLLEASGLVLAMFLRFSAVETTVLLAFLVPGVLICLGDFVLHFKEFRFRQGAAKAVGVIRERNELESGVADAMPHIVITVEFEDSAGTTRTASVAAVRGGIRFSRSGRRDYEIGDSLPIVYDIERPWVIRIDTFLNLWLWPLVLGMVGAGFVGVSLLVLSGAVRPE
jgi:hypothetical protein